MTLGQLGQYEDAARAFDKAIGLAPDDAKVYYNKALMLQQLGRSTKALTQQRERYQEALVACSQAIERDPHLAPAHDLRGFLLWSLGQSEEALAAYEQAIALDPYVAEVHNGRGNILRRLGRTEEALSAYEQAVQVDPHFVYGHNGRGCILYKLGRYQEALQAFDQAIACDSQFLYAWHHKADVFLQLGRGVEAERIYKQAYEIAHQSLQDKAMKEVLLASPVTLEKKLLSLGGKRMVYRYEPDVETLLKRGEVFADPAELVPGKSHECHGNAARLWYEQRESLAIVTGYALSEDSLWRQHSWLLRKHPTAEQCRIIETTIKRVKYFGFVLTDKEAEAFKITVNIHIPL